MDLKLVIIIIKLNIFILNSYESRIDCDFKYIIEFWDINRSVYCKW